MIKTIEISERDRQALQRLQQLAPATGQVQPQSYRDRVVVKPWGYEFLIFQNEFTAVWFLHIAYGHSTSMHCHPQKKTSLIVVSGRAFCNTFSSRNYLDSLSGIMIQKGVFHSTKCLSKGGLDLIEVESPPNKTDLVRLNDSYGRESSGYEGLSEMKEQSLERYGYFYLSEDSNAGQQQVLRSGVEISLSCSSKAEGSEPVTADNAALYCALRGSLLKTDGTCALACGDLSSNCKPGTATLCSPGRLTLLQLRKATCAS